ncbi:MAG TPA: trypsin-like peptidase domain-containing protein [Streptosporangiaceae bacterium]|nr:trypsin-like peptidase domain-containing protein [Streptosporangiaceae bacterium]
MPRFSGLPAVAAATAAAFAAGAIAGCSSSSAASNAPASRLEAQYEQTVRSVLPSVVQIATDNSTGSGVVYDRHGDIVTNLHVVGTAKTVKVQETVGNMSVTGKVIGEFGPDDLAVIRVEGDTDNLKPAKFANSNSAQIGEIVLAMGNPLGLTDSVTQGIISATGRIVGSGEPGGGKALISAAIQTSAAINPGNSGGALVTLNSEVIGIPTLTARLPGENGVAPGIGFAIPSDTVRDVADQIIKSGKVTNPGTGTLGITAQTAANSTGKPAGVAVLAVAGGSTAAGAGVRKGDIIVKLDSRPVANLEQLEDALADLMPGTMVTIHYRRGSTVRKGSAKLASISS